MRRKRPPALSFLLRMATVRRVARVVSLLALDFVGRVARDLHGARAQGGACTGSVAPCTTRFTRPNTDPRLRLPADRAAVRALGPLRRARAAPRPVAHRRLAVPGRVRRADLRGGQRRTLLQLLHLLRLARLRAVLRLLAALRATSGPPGAILRAAGYRRRAVLVGTGKHIDDVAHALADAPHSPVEVVGFVSPEPLPANGLRCARHAG